LYAQLLIAISLVAGAYQDIRERAVSDLVWIPGVVGIAYMLYALYAGGSSVEGSLLRMLIFGGIALVGTLLGRLGQADPIAWTILAADPSQLSPLFPLGAGAILLMGHILVEARKGNLKKDLTIPLDRFLKEQCWIPRAIVTDQGRVEVDQDVNVAREDVVKKAKQGSMVEVSYGVPHVAYFGIGYAVYLAYLVVFSPQTIMMIP
jgi:Flp pilus assembly protein protease CpaA